MKSILIFLTLLFLMNCNLRAEKKLTDPILIHNASDCRTGNDIEWNNIDRIEEINSLDDLLKFRESEGNRLVIDNLAGIVIKPEDQELCKGADFVILVYDNYME